ncbi:hypothetical protein LINPERPRIM_LOCUS5911 [Linum perenne]
MAALLDRLFQNIHIRRHNHRINLCNQSPNPPIQSLHSTNHYRTPFHCRFLSARFVFPIRFLVCGVAAVVSLNLVRPIIRYN